jgi:hypothetical protein
MPNQNSAPNSRQNSQMGINSIYSAPITNAMDELSKKNSFKIENDLHLKPLVIMDKTIDSRQL